MDVYIRTHLFRRLKHSSFLLLYQYVAKQTFEDDDKHPVKAKRESFKQVCMFAVG